MTNEIPPPPLTTTNIKTKIKNKTPKEAWQPIHTKKETIKPHNHTTIGNM
jgi:hypothetical protein